MRKITQPQIDFIELNGGRFTDKYIGDILGVSDTTVLTYRKMLGVEKNHITNNFKHSDQKESARIELNALVEFNYQGIMQDSVDRRINYLSNLVAC